MNWSALRAELTNDPLGRGYSTMTSNEVVSDLNTAYRTRNRTSLTGDEIFQQTDPAEFSALGDGGGSAANIKGQWLSFCSRASVDPFAPANEAFVTQVFGGSSATIANLVAARTESVSRATELGLSGVRGTDVELARTL